MEKQTSIPDSDTVIRVRLLYTSGISPHYIMGNFRLTEETFHKILSGKYGKGSFGKKSKNIP